MPLSYFPGMDDHNNANRLCTISTSVPPANNDIPPADHGIPPAHNGIPPADSGIPPTDNGIPVPPPSPDTSKMLPPPTPSIMAKEKEKDESNVGGLLINLAKGGSEDGTSTPTEKDAVTVPPAPTEQDAGTSPPAPTGQEAGTTPDTPTDPKQKGTPKHAAPPLPAAKVALLMTTTPKMKNK
jgi:hypothetical protein